MSEIMPPVARQDIADRMYGTLADSNPAVMFNLIRGDFVERVASRNLEFISEPLAVVQPDNRRDMPVYWRFMVPSRRSPDQIEKVEFGLHDTMWLGFIHDPAHDVREAEAVKADLRIHAPKLAVQGLFAAVGGEIARFVTAAGDPIFAGIERRHARRWQDGESTPIAWSQLVYSKELLRTSSLIGRKADVIRKSGAEVPSWMDEAADLDNRRLVARLMALSALTGAMAAEE